ncbi:MAG: DUF4395 domain-containing protein [Actinomycetota bacterium]|nr:DUF4395 domain-containing protein [Actinomycetota bacterium]
MIDSRIPRFSQAIQAVLLAIAFLLDARFIVIALAVVLVAAALGGPRWNVLAHLYQALPISPGELEPAAPPRFAQTLGAVFLTISSVALVTTAAESMPSWIVGWGVTLLVAVLSGLAAAASF